MSDDKSLLEYVSEVTELNDLSDYMNDPTLDEALGIVLKLVVKSDVPAKVAAPLVVQLQAMALKFKMQGKYYMLYGKTDEDRKKKNTYLSMSEGLEKVVDALKYLVKTF